jgi:hypothetical protein
MFYAHNSNEVCRTSTIECITSCRSDPTVSYRVRRYGMTAANVDSDPKMQCTGLANGDVNADLDLEDGFEHIQGSFEFSPNFEHNQEVSWVRVGHLELVGVDMGISLRGKSLDTDLRYTIEILCNQ